MKKIFIALIILFIIQVIVFADDNSGGYGGIEDAMQKTNSVEDAFNGQKPVTDEEFQKTLNRVKSKQKKGKNKIKGKGFNEESSGTHIDEAAEKNSVLSVPLNLINGDGIEIPIGHYKIVGTKKDKEVYLDFYQSSNLVARVPAIETESDFNEMNINFVKLMPYDSKRIKIIYGSIDFNAYTFIRIEKEISDLN